MQRRKIRPIHLTKTHLSSFFTIRFFLNSVAFFQNPKLTSFSFLDFIWFHYSNAAACLLGQQLVNSPGEDLVTQNKKKFNLI